ncbi:MAG: GcvT family protein, partial [Mycobacteriaceae bacterium]
VLGLTRVTAVLTEEGRVTGVVGEDAGDAGDAREAPRTIPADTVVSAGGIWGHPLAKLGGLRVPMHPMEHGFAFTEPVPSLPGTRPDGTPLPDDEPSRPIVRHQGAGIYFREFGGRIGIGAYEHRPIPLPPAELTDTPHMLATGEHPAKRTFTPADFAFTKAELGRILPPVRDLELQDEFNGVFSFTPDGGPMLGPSPSVAGFWCAQAVWVTQSAGCAQVVADWMLTGDPGIDTHELDHTRFDPAVLSDAWIRGRAAENYDEIYDIHFPHQSTAVTRGLKTSPFHTRTEQAGGVFAEHNGWERPLWHESNTALFSDPAFTTVEARVTPGPVELPGTPPTVPVSIPRRDAWDRVNWSPVAAAEAWATRNRVAVYDMTSLTRVTVRGTGATAFLESQCTNLIDKPIGRTHPVVYSLLLDEQGGILSDVTVTRTADEEYMLGVNGALDVSRLRRAAQEAAPGVTVDDITTSTCCIGLWGPRARDVLTPLAEGDVSDGGLMYFRAARMFVAGVPVLIQRVSYVGELGWEIYAPAAHGLHLWDGILSAGRTHGIVPAGRLAFNSLRTEKGYLSWAADMSRENTPQDAGLGFAVKMDGAVKPSGFVGKDALLRSPSRGRTLVTFVSRSDAGIPGAGSPVYRAGDPGVVGWVTGADTGYVTGQVVGTAWVDGGAGVEGLTTAGSALTIRRFGRMLDAVVVTAPLYDPEGSRIRR